jgi:hypothetical protein
MILSGNGIEPEFLSNDVNLVVPKGFDFLRPLFKREEEN